MHETIKILHQFCATHSVEITPAHSVILLRYINVFLKKVAQGGMIIYSPSRKAFYSRKQGTQTLTFKAENYTNITGGWEQLDMCSM